MLQMSRLKGCNTSWFTIGVLLSESKRGGEATMCCVKCQMCVLIIYAIVQCLDYVIGDSDVDYTTERLLGCKRFLL